jgi:hypothetical protein
VNFQNAWCNNKDMRRGLKIFVGLVDNMKYLPGNVASCVRKVLYGIIFQKNGVPSHVTVETSRQGGSNKRHEKLA